MLRRTFLAFFAAGPPLSSRERVDRALAGKDVDRPPFTVWYHFGLEKEGPASHAKATLDFQRKFTTDLVKVMSDFPYPKPGGNWWDLKIEQNPFALQIKALEIIREELAGRKHFVETIFNPWNIAEKLSSKDDLQRMKEDNPQRLLDALQVIARSEANHARRAIQAGASGVFLAIANADPGTLSPADYEKFSEPFDRVVLQAASSAPLNILHLHGDKIYLDRFYKRWPAAAINYSVHGTHVPIAELRKHYSGVIMGGLDERGFRTLTEQNLRSQAEAARAAAGPKFILTPGCSVPNDTADGEINRLVTVLKA
jgi:uroporphyrinogen decarboxylase